MLPFVSDLWTEMETCWIRNSFKKEIMKDSSVDDELVEMDCNRLSSLSWCKLWSFLLLTIDQHVSLNVVLFACSQVLCRAVLTMSMSLPLLLHSVSVIIKTNSKKVLEHQRVNILTVFLVWATFWLKANTLWESCPFKK